MIERLVFAEGDKQTEVILQNGEIISERVIGAKADENIQSLEKAVGENEEIEQNIKKVVNKRVITRRHKGLLKIKKLTAKDGEKITKRKTKSDKNNRKDNKNKVIKVQQKESIAEKVVRKNEEKQEEERKSEVRKAEKAKLTRIKKAKISIVQKRFTEPKKRNILSRIILQQKLAKDYYDYIEDDYEYITQGEVNESKNASKRRDRRFYKEVQQYEDAREDITVKKGWLAFKAGLAATVLAGTMFVGYQTYNEFKEFTSNFLPPILTIENITSEQMPSMVENVEKFKYKVAQRDGYEFENLTDEELMDGYLRMLSIEKKMYEAEFGPNIKDQEKLDSIVKKAFDVEYETFSDEQKRDYKQLAFELLPEALPKVYEKNHCFIRNPIVMDALEARNTARENGYEIKMIVNSDRPQTVKNLGRLLHIENTLPEWEYKILSGYENDRALEDLLRKAIGDEYDKLSGKDRRDYQQFAYEFLPKDVKEKYIKNPIDVEREIEQKTNNTEMGEER